MFDIFMKEMTIIIIFILYKYICMDSLINKLLLLISTCIIINID